ncbi:MAG TPA: hypothetical protein VHZ51_25345 [Ktedonobacteraceae bacterium]|nr:hypothetical protein [Ktedonobacteraceae bacterium]
MVANPQRDHDTESIHGIPMTEEAFEGLIGLESPYHYELIDEVVYDMTGSDPEHSVIAGNIEAELHIQLAENSPGYSTGGSGRSFHASTLPRLRRKSGSGVGSRETFGLRGCGRTLARGIPMRRRQALPRVCPLLQSLMDRPQARLRTFPGYGVPGT